MTTIVGSTRNGIEARAATPADRDDVLELAARFAWPERRGVVVADVDLAPVAARVEAMGGLDQEIASVATSDSGAAFVAAVPDDWGSRHLGVSFARLTTLPSSGDRASRVALASAALELTTERARGAGIEMLVCRVDADDDATIEAVAAAGYQHMDSEVVYLGDAWGPDARPVDAGNLEVTVHRSDDLPRFSDDERRPLLDRAAGFRQSHIGADHRIDRDAKASFYRAWTDNAMAGRWGDRLAVARADGRVIGVFSWVLDDLAGGDGPTLLHRSWSVVSEEGRGAFGAMLRAVVFDRSPDTGVRFTECDTQASNVAVNRAFERIGLSTIRRCHVFHRWTGDE